MTFLEYALREFELSKNYSCAYNNGDEKGVFESRLKFNELVSDRNEVSGLVKLFKIVYGVKDVETIKF